MNEDAAYEILNRHLERYYQENSTFVLEYKYWRLGREGKEFVEAFNIIFGDHGKPITFNNIPYEVINGDYHIYNGSKLDAYLTPNLAKGFLKETHNTIVNTDKVAITAQEVTIYTDVLREIVSQRFMMEDELALPQNNDILMVLKNIEKALKNEKSPHQTDLHFLRNIAKSTSELASFAANIITILSPFLR